jgi:hypothetical protein
MGGAAFGGGEWVCVRDERRIECCVARIADVCWELTCGDCLHRKTNVETTVVLTFVGLCDSFGVRLEFVGAAAFAASNDSRRVQRWTCF